MNEIRVATDDASRFWARLACYNRSKLETAEEIEKIEDFYEEDSLRYPFQGGAMQDVAYETLESFSHEK